MLGMRTKVRAITGRGRGHVYIAITSERGHVSIQILNMAVRNKSLCEMATLG